MGDEHGGAPLGDLLDGLLDHGLGGAVDVGRGLVQHQNLRVVGDGAGEGDQLPLAGGERRAALGHHVVNAALQAVHKIQRAGLFQRRLHFPVGDRRVNAHVVRDGAHEQEHVLKHHGDLSAQRLLLPLVQRHAVHQNLAPLRHVEPAQQRYDGGLARAGGAHKGDLVSGLAAEAQPAQHPVFALVGEPHVLKFDAALHVPGVSGRVQIFQICIVLQQGEHAVGGHHGGLNGVVVLGQVVDGLEELLDVGVERHQHAHLQRRDLRARQPEARDQDQRDAQRVDDLGHGPHERVDEHLKQRGLAVFAVHAVQLVVLLLLPVEGLNHADAGQALGDEAVDAPDPHLHLHEVAVQRPLAAQRDDGDQRQRGKAHQRQLPVHVQHHGHDADEQEHVLEQVHQHAAVELVQRLHVVGGSGQQPSAAHAVQIGQLHAVDVVGQLHAQAVQDPLAHAGDQHGLGVGRRGAEQRHQKVADAQADQRSGEPVLPGHGRVFAAQPRVGRQKAVDGDFHDVGLEQLRQVQHHA